MFPLSGRYATDVHQAPALAGNPAVTPTTFDYHSPSPYGLYIA